MIVRLWLKVAREFRAGTVGAFLVRRGQGGVVYEFQEVKRNSRALGG
jgi:hypothetical protein